MIPVFFECRNFFYFTVRLSLTLTLMDLVYFLKVLYRRKWIIMLLSAIAVVAAFAFLVNKKPLFVSVAQYSTGFTAEKVKLVDGSTAIDLYTVDVKFDNVIETIKSPQVV